MGAMRRPIEKFVRRLSVLDLQHLLDEHFPQAKLIVNRSSDLHWVVQIDYRDGTVSSSSVRSLEYAFKECVAKKQVR